MVLDEDSVMLFKNITWVYGQVILQHSMAFAIGGVFTI